MTVRFTASIEDDKAAKLTKLLTPAGAREIKRGRLSKLFNIFIDVVVAHPQFVKACREFSSSKELLQYEEMCQMLNDMDKPEEKEV